MDEKTTKLIRRSMLMKEDRTPSRTPIDCSAIRVGIVSSNSLQTCIFHDHRWRSGYWQKDLFDGKYRMKLEKPMHCTINLGVTIYRTKVNQTRPLDITDEDSNKVFWSGKTGSRLLPGQSLLEKKCSMYCYLDYYGFTWIFPRIDVND